SSHSSFLSCNHPSPPDLYPLSLHDALPIFTGTSSSSSSSRRLSTSRPADASLFRSRCRSPLRTTVSRLAQSVTRATSPRRSSARSEEHTSELQSLTNLVCRLLLEKKKNTLH